MGLAKHGWALGTCVVTLLAGAWLMLAPFALGYQGYGASWSTQTINQFWLGLGVVVFSALGLALFAIALASELREAGVLGGPPPVSHQAHTERGPVSSAPAQPAVALPSAPMWPATSSPSSASPSPTYPPLPSLAYAPSAPRPMTRAILEAEGHIPPRPAMVAALDQLDRFSEPVVPPRTEAETAPPLSSAQASQLSARSGDSEQFERAVLMLAQSLAEDLAERRARRGMPRTNEPADEDERGTPSPPLEGAGTR
jgi:hypothetical protein